MCVKKLYVESNFIELAKLLLLEGYNISQYSMSNYVKVDTISKEHYLLQLLLKLVPLNITISLNAIE